MPPHWKPDGYTSVAPYLIVDDAAAVVAFLHAAFDATELRRYELPDGSIMHAELQIDDSIVMLADGSDEYPPFPSLIHVYVEDVDRTYQRALDTGATAVQEPAQQDRDPDKRGSVTDSAGNTWSIATQGSD